MRTLLFILLIPSMLLAQSGEKTVTLLDKFADHADSLILNSSGAPGEVYSCTINVQRNVRAIGMQNTKITFYYYQAEDSVYEIDGAVFFLPRYNLPVKITAEYNIAASQSVISSYYIDGDKYLNRFISTGAYGNMYRNFWISGGELLKYISKDSNEGQKEVIQSGKFSKEVYSDGIIVMDRIRDYIKLYYDIFEIEYKDK